MRILVTGGGGFIGANLCRTLLARPAVSHVTVIDDFSTGFRSNLDGLDVRLVEGTILNGDALSEAMLGVDAVVHLAALGSVPRSVADPVSSHTANATGSLKVLEAARERRLHTIVASSSSVYGSNPVLPKHENLATLPLSPYAASKLATEAYALAYGASYEMPMLVFRFFNVFGPLQAAGQAYAAVIPAFIDAALRGRSLTVYGDGRQSRDFTFVGTVASLIAEALERQIVSAAPVNLAFGSRTTLLEVIEGLEEILGYKLPVEYAAPRKGDVMHSQADNTRLRELFGAVAPVAFSEGLRETVDWMKLTIADDSPVDTSTS